MEQPEFKGEPDKILKCLETIKKVGVFFDDGKYKEAIEEWPHFPRAWLAHYEMNRAALHKESKGKFEWLKENFLMKALQSCPGDPGIFLLTADIAMRYDQYKTAVNFVQKALENSPNDSRTLTALSHCYRQMSLRVDDKDSKIKMIEEAKKTCNLLKRVSFQSGPDAMTWIFSDNADLPCPWEKD